MQARATGIAGGCRLALLARPGAASKMAGALSWAACQQFHRVGRAMIRPLFGHAHAADPKLPSQLRNCLCWWEDVLGRDVAETRPWRGDAREPVLVFSDARGAPARIAAVVVLDGAVEFADLAPPPECIGQLARRSDGQIAGLELLSVLLAIGTWGERLRGRAVRFFSDNTIAEWALRKGAAAALDHDAIVYQFWLLVGVLGLRVRIDRVPTGAAARAGARRDRVRLPRARRRQRGGPPQQGGLPLAVADEGGSRSANSAWRAEVPPAASAACVAIVHASAQGRKGRAKYRRAPPAGEARAQRPCAGAMRTLPGGNVSSAALAGFDPGVPRCVVERAARVLLANDLYAFSALAAAPPVETWVLTAKRRRGARAPAARDRVQDADGPAIELLKRLVAARKSAPTGPPPVPPLPGAREAPGRATRRARGGSSGN